jgi:hypothetical protein
MKKYLYTLDSFNRITYIKETDLDSIDLENHYISEFNEDEVKNISFGISGIVDGKIYEIGLTLEEINKDNKFNKISQIESLKNRLLETDYQVIKCYEASLLNEEMPYDLQELLTQRKVWRNEINQLEFEIAMLG